MPLEFLRKIFLKASNDTCGGTTRGSFSGENDYFMAYDANY